MRPLLVVLALASAVSADEPTAGRRELTALVRRLRVEPKGSHRIAWSAYVCGWQSQRAADMAEIGEQRKYARIGGAIDLSVMRDLQDKIRRADEAIADGRAELRALKVTQIPCSARSVHVIAMCVNTGDDADTTTECEDDTIQAFLMLLRENDGLDADEIAEPKPKQSPVVDPYAVDPCSGYETLLTGAKELALIAERKAWLERCRARNAKK